MKIQAELDSGKTPVFATAHTSLLPCVLVWDGMPGVFIASLSKDGTLIARILEKRGFKLVRGSSSRGGVQALSELHAGLQLGLPVGITFDGPRGPPLVAKKGVASCARLASGKSFFVYAKPLPSRILGRPLCLNLRSWDRFHLPLPFCKIQIVCEEVILEKNEGLSEVEWDRCYLACLEAQAKAALGYLYLK